MSPFSPLLEQAAELAAQWHDRTYRKGRWRPVPFEAPEEEAEIRVPVMAHVTAVAMSVQRAGWNEKAVAAAFLHDALEDANRFGQSMRRGTLRRRMGKEVLRIVEAVTEEKLDVHGHPRPWRARKEGYLASLRQGPPEAVAVSLADKKHNLWTMNESLERGIDVFASTATRTGLSAGPEEQDWFHAAVLELSHRFEDARLPPLRLELEEEIHRFRERIGFRKNQA